MRQPRFERGTFGSGGRVGRQQSAPAFRCKFGPPYLRRPCSCRSDVGTTLRTCATSSSSLNAGGTEDTYALHLADLTTRRLIAGDAATSGSLPAWSPDTRSIAFVRACRQ